MKNQPPTEITTLSLHDALPICGEDVVLHGPLDATDRRAGREVVGEVRERAAGARGGVLERLRDAQVEIRPPDRKSTRLNSSHVAMSYAVFSLKKKTHQYRSA